MRPSPSGCNVPPMVTRWIEAPEGAALMALHFDDADPVARCLIAKTAGPSGQCGWHGHGDSINDAVKAWTGHLTAEHRDDWE